MGIALPSLLSCPRCQAPLIKKPAPEEQFRAGTTSELSCSKCENVWPVVNGIPRFTSAGHYSSSFGYQWTKFGTTQLDTHSGSTHSNQRLFSETGWQSKSLREATILEIGCGAGRFTQVILDSTDANLVSVDSSGAIDVNMENNGHHDRRILLIQASLYELPLPDSKFDKVLCLGVLQHTPDAENSIKALIEKTRPGGEIVVDFYQRKGWWTWLQAKYILRPIAKRLTQQQLLSLLKANITRLVRIHLFLQRLGLHVLTRFVPVVDITSTFPDDLPQDQLYQWAILDTFDMFAPKYDQPQRISDVVEMFERNGANVTFAGRRDIGTGSSAAVVTAMRT